MNYTYSNEESQEGSIFKVKKYVDGGNLNYLDKYGSSATGTMNIGPGFNIPVVQSLLGCSSCDSASLSNIIVDGKS